LLVETNYNLTANLQLRGSLLAAAPHQITQGCQAGNIPILKARCVLRQAGRHQEQWRVLKLTTLRNFPSVTALPDRLSNDSQDFRHQVRLGDCPYHRARPKINCCLRDTADMVAV
jgi:hypothetical protein